MTISYCPKTGFVRVGQLATKGWFAPKRVLRGATMDHAPGNGSFPAASDFTGWLNQQQQDLIDYLQEENRVLRAQLGGKRLRFNDDQRRRLAVRAKKLGRPMLTELTTIVTPATLLGWHRR